MSIEIRPISEDEFPTLGRAIGTAFGEPITAEDLERERTTFEIDRSLAAFDDGRMVGTAGAVSFQLTLPGLTQIPVAGITAVSVLPTHTRRGILTSLMRRQLDDVAKRGEAVAILLASESVIYGRYGYGMSTTQVSLSINPHYNRFHRAPPESGQVRMIDATEAARVLPSIYDIFRRRQPGATDLSAAMWTRRLEDRPEERRGRSEPYFVIHQPEQGPPDGYVMYRLKGEWPYGIPSYLLSTQEIIATSPEAHAALWRYVLNVDLVSKVEAGNVPVDEPVRWMLADPRRLRVTEYGDFLWTRLVQPEAALSARRYAMDGQITFDVTDPFLPHNSGRYRLEGSPDGATCRRTDATADLTLDIADLGAVYLGGVSFRTLARAGRVHGTQEALARADLMFRSDPPPFCATHF